MQLKGRCGALFLWLDGRQIRLRPPHRTRIGTVMVRSDGIAASFI
jgi:hypothetical protein